MQNIVDRLLPDGLDELQQLDEFIEENWNNAMATAIKHTRKITYCPRCGRPQPDMVISNGRLYTELGHVLVIAYVCSGCERIVHWGKRGDGKTDAG